MLRRIFSPTPTEPMSCRLQLRRARQELREERQRNVAKNGAPPKPATSRSSASSSAAAGGSRDGACDFADTTQGADVCPTGDDGAEQGSWTRVLGSCVQAWWPWLRGQLSCCSAGRAPRHYQRNRRFDRSLDSSAGAGGDKKRHMTKQRAELLSRMKRVPLRKVQESLGSRMGSKGAKTKASYASSAENYLVFAEEAGFPAYPLHEGDVLNFIAYALYPDPIWDSIRGTVTAVMSVNSDKGYGNLESDEADNAVAAYERDAPESEQAYPFSTFRNPLWWWVLRPLVYPLYPPI